MSRAEPTQTLTQTLTVAAAESGARLDRYLAAALPGLSRTRAQALIARGEVRVEGRAARASQVVEAGQTITMSASQQVSGDAERPSIAPEPIPVPIVYEDDALLVVDKPAGLVVHPAPGHPTGTLVNALAGRLARGTRAPGDALRPGIVHRLDKDTSGLMVVARDEVTHAALAAQMKAHRTVKRYLALVEGRMPVPEGAIEAPIGRDPRQRQRMALVSVEGG